MRDDAILGTSKEGSDHLHTAGASRTLAHPQDCRRGPRTERRRAAGAHSPAQLLARPWRRHFSSAGWQTHRQPLLAPRLPTNGAADPIAPISARRPAASGLFLTRQSHCEQRPPRSPARKRRGVSSRRKA